MSDPETEAGLPVTKAELQAMRDWRPHRFEDVQGKLEQLQRRLAYAQESGTIEEAAYWEILSAAADRVQEVLEQTVLEQPRPA